MKRKLIIVDNTKHKCLKCNNQSIIKVKTNHSKYYLCDECFGEMLKEMVEEIGVKDNEN